MPFLTPFPQNHLKTIFLVLSIFISPSVSDPRISEAGLICGTSRLSDSEFIPNFSQLMGKLKDIVFKQRWGVDSVSSPLPKLNGFAQCHEDLSQVDCNVCFSVARGRLSTCLVSSSGRIFLDGCYARYETGNVSIMGGPIDPETDKVKCSNATGVLTGMKTEFVKKLTTVIDNVTRAASINNGFAVAEVKGGVTSVYALAQCWKTVNDRECVECLKDAMKVVDCAPGKEGRVMNAGCFLRYSTDKFFGADAESNGTSNISIMVGSVSGAVAFTLLLIFGAFVGYKRLQKKREQEHNDLIWASARINKSSLNFKYETLEKATAFFHSSMKLGQGGAGSVYKGTLPDGKVVAVKRLFYSTRQWVDEFFNELNLISVVQHKNLVKLLGCSIEGPESLLVYEYVSNGNLEDFLNEKSRTRILSWKQRTGIISGTADGLAYLHGGSASPLKIIHRDIKGSNILLDENLTPKIADFGLVRCLAADKSHISTGIAGTLGYMAPEYLVRGQLTEKADVYAFGVLVLEIVCGRKNTVFSGESSSVLQSVWKHYMSNRLPETVDPCLKGDFPTQEASNVLQIGLLCTQALPALRPSMLEVLQMLNGEKFSIPSPQQPPFLNSSVFGAVNTTKSFTMPNLSLNTATTNERSSHYMSLPTAACHGPNGHLEIENSSKGEFISDNLINWGNTSV